MSDNELVAWCRENVLPKPAPDPMLCSVCGWPFREDGCTKDSCSERPVPKPREWRPLESWDDCQLIIDAIATKSYTVRKAFQDAVTKNGTEWYADIDKKDVLESALKACKMIEPEQEAVTS